MREIGAENRWVSPREVIIEVKRKYGDEGVNEGTIRAQLYYHSINHPSRLHALKPMWKDLPLFRYSKSRGYKLLSAEEKKLFRIALQLHKPVIEEKFYTKKKLKDSLTEKSLDKKSRDFGIMLKMKILEIFEESDKELTIGDIAAELGFTVGSEKYNKVQSTLLGLLKEEKISRRKLYRKIENSRGVESTRKIWHYQLKPNFEGSEKEPKRTIKVMKDFVDTLRENVKGYSEVHSKIIKLAPEVFKIFQTLTKREALDPSTEKLVNSVISYFVLPYDALPESELGPFGYVDDLYLCAYVINNLKKKKEKLIRGCWKGEGDIFKVSSQILDEVEKSPVDSIDKALLEDVLER